MKITQYEDNGLAAEQEFLAGLSRHELDEDAASSGVPLQYKDGAVYTDDTDSHTLIFGNTGSKKTRNFCIPGVYTIGMAGESMVVSDPKGEIYCNTSGFLAEQGYEVKVLNLREPECSAKWNPLTLPYRHYREGDTDRAIEMISDLALQLKAQVHAEHDPFWENQAMDMLIGLILILFECETDEKKVHMESIWHIRKYVRPEGKEEDSNIFWDLLQTFPETSMIRYKLASLYALRHTEKTFPCIISSFDAMFRVFLFNNKIMGMLDSMEIDFQTLGERKTALYLILPDEKTTFHFLVSVFVKQCYECLIEHAQNLYDGALPKRVNFILDEFSNFPKIADMPAMISAARSRNMRFVLIVQSRQQLFSMYGDDAETIKSNCRNWIYLSCRELELLKEIQALCGTVCADGRGDIPLLSISKLQALKIGWEDSQALILRAGIRPYISWVKDFSVYPQTQYGMLPFVQRKLMRPDFFSIPGYLYQKVMGDMGDEEEDAGSWDDLMLTEE
ncbi:MAG: type IV secretory system conjugative DNA transfer family protein [Ruminococcus flavefaciens]|nr:type IV secretory system conjugative DNA transfer family protein [Ruminococcus flavefaciens]